MLVTGCLVPAHPHQREQTAAKFEGYNALFLLLAAGWNP
jgi:hypothetical protein